MTEAGVSLGPSELQLQQAVRVAIAATERGDYVGAIKVFKAVYEDPKLKPSADGLSFYGLCLAMEDKQTKRGIELCRAAIAAQSYDSRHYANLIRLNLKRTTKKAALEVLEEAMKRLPNDPLLMKLGNEAGYRPPPPIPFLSHDNIINKLLARKKKKKGLQRKYLTFGNIHPAVGFLLVALLFAVVFGVTFLVLYHQAYR